MNPIIESAMFDMHKPDQCRPVREANGDNPKARIAELEKKLTALRDDPENDATDCAHPAWWRGHDTGCLDVTRKLQKAVDGKDDGQGVTSHPEIEKCRRDILALRKQIAKCEAKNRELWSYLETYQQSDEMVTNGSIVSEHVRLKAQLDEAAEALRPFTAVSMELEPELWDDRQLLFAQGSGVSVGHLRQAAAVLAKLKGGAA